MRPAEARAQLEASPLHPPRLLEDVSLLPAWARIAISRVTLQGHTKEQAAKKANRSAATLSGYLSSPAGKEWARALEERVANVEELARATLNEMVFNVTLDALWALEVAKEKEDHAEVFKMSKWFLERPEMLGAVQKNEAPQIVINLPAGASLDVPMGASTHAIKQIADVMRRANSAGST